MIKNIYIYNTHTYMEKNRKKRKRKSKENKDRYAYTYVLLVPRGMKHDVAEKCNRERKKMEETEIER